MSSSKPTDYVHKSGEWEKYKDIKPVQIPKIKLNTGAEMPLLAFGTSRSGSDTSIMTQAIKFAIKLGYRNFDVAWVYFIDSLVGCTLKEVMREQSLQREEFFLGCKVWNTFHRKDILPIGLNDTLSNLKTDYLDLYLLHWPIAFEDNPGYDPYPLDKEGNLMFSETHYLEAYHTMEELVEQGKIKSIGVSNFNISQLEDIIKNCHVKPAVNQIEVHPYLQNDKLIEFCQNNGIVVMAYSPLGAKDLAELKHIPNLLEDETLIRIGKKYNKTPAQVSIRWCLQRGLVVVPKAITPEKIIENTQVFDFELSDEDMRDIKKLNKNLRIYNIPDQKQNKFYPFNED